MLYELLTYRHAFAADTAQLVMMRILQTEPPSARDVVPDIDISLQDTLDKAMAKDRDRRYESLAALSVDLERALVNHRNAAVLPTVRLESIRTRDTVVESAVPPQAKTPAGSTQPGIGATVLLQPAAQGAARGSTPMWLVAAGLLLVVGAVVAYFLTGGRTTEGGGQASGITTPSPVASPPATSPAVTSTASTPPAATPDPTPAPGPPPAAAIPPATKPGPRASPTPALPTSTRPLRATLKTRPAVPGSANAPVWVTR